MADDAAFHSTPRTTESHAWRSCLIAALIFFLVMVGLTCIVGWVLYQRYKLPDKFLSVETQLQAIRDAGLPASLKELEAWYPPVPDEENAAPLLEKAFAAFQDVHQMAIPFLDNLELPELSEPFPQEQLWSVLDFLAKCQTWLNYLHEAGAKPKCRFPMDPTRDGGRWFPHLKPMRYSGKLLALEAITQAEQGDANGAAESLTDVMKLAADLKNEPFLYSQMFRSALHHSFAMGIEQVLSRRGFDEIQVNTLQQTVLAEIDETSLFRALVGERCLGIEAFAPGPATRFSAGSAYAFPAKLPFAKGSNFRTYLYYANRLVALSRLSSQQRAKGMEALSVELEKDSHRFGLRLMAADFLVIPPSHTYQFHDRDAATLRSCNAVLALERYRLRNGRLPNRLDDLVPEFLASVPEDPYDGKPIRYVQTERGFIVYSIGEDLTDDGGVEHPFGTRTRLLGDVTFEWISPEHRGH